MTPYKYVVLALPRSQSFWLSDFLGFDHDASAQIAAGTFEKKSEGLVDTGIYMMPEMLNQLVTPETRIIRMRRSLDEIALSFENKFGLTYVQGLMLARHLNHELWDEFKEYPMVFAPLTPESVMEIEDMLAIPEDQRHSFMQICEALSVKKDRADDPAYVAKARHHMSSFFNLNP